jgi:tRNA dimethylallyltransferase
LAIAIAQALNSCILGADSRQVYRELDIGTAKPTRQERAQISHSLIDICEPTATLTLADYQALAQTQIAQAATVPLLVGGTGLYIKAIVRGLKIPRVAPQPELRASLAALGQAHCYALLAQVDRTAAAKIHPHDATRTLRALEVFYVTGQPISTQQGDNPPPYPILQLGLDTDNLRDRIVQRTHQMIAQGLVAEVEQLQAKYGAALPLLKTLGYAEIQNMLAGHCTLPEAIEQIVTHTRQFAKRQRTWFRADPSIHWLDSSAPDLRDRALSLIATWRLNLKST